MVFTPVTPTLTNIVEASPTPDLQIAGQTSPILEDAALSHTAPQAVLATPAIPSAPIQIQDPLTQMLSILFEADGHPELAGGRLGHVPG